MLNASAIRLKTCPIWTLQVGVKQVPAKIPVGCNCVEPKGALLLAQGLTESRMLQQFQSFKHWMQSEVSGSADTTCEFMTEELKAKSYASAGCSHCGVSGHEQEDCVQLKATAAAAGDTDDLTQCANSAMLLSLFPVI